MPARPVGVPRRARIAVLLGVALPLAGMAAGAAPAAPAAPRPGDWRRYVLAPPTRHVAPVAVIAASAGVRDPAALLARDGRTARFERRLLRGKLRWPAGATATASGTPPRHPAAAAIDGDPDTWWQGGTLGRLPATLTIRAPRPLRLPGVTLVSSSRGWVLDAVVEARARGRWARAGSVRGARTLTVAIPFAAPVTTDRVRVRVLRAWFNGGFPLRQRERPRLVEVVPGLLGDAYADLDFGRVVAGRLEVTVAGASRPAPGVRLAVAELRRDLGPRSDYSPSDYGPDVAAGGGDEGVGTDQLRAPPAGGTWVDRKGCRAGRKLCADGVRGFR